MKSGFLAMAHFTLFPQLVQPLFQLLDLPVQADVGLYRALQPELGRSGLRLGRFDPPVSFALTLRDLLQGGLRFLFPGLSLPQAGPQRPLRSWRCAGAPQPCGFSLPPSPRRRQGRAPARPGRPVPARPPRGEGLPSRPQRWRNAVETLVDLQGEYQAWLDNLPDSLRASVLAECLQAICEHDFGDLEALEPPRGFGRD